jgi:hypothetical protein
MKTFRFKAVGDPDGHPDNNEVNEALGAMAVASEAQAPAGETLLVAALTDQDLERAIGANMMQEKALADLRRDNGQLLLLITAVLQQHHRGHLKLTQSQLDEAANKKFSASAAPGSGYVELTVVSGPSKIIL